MTGVAPTTVISDANVLIDYCLSDKTVLKLAAQHLCSVVIPRPVLEEVDQLDERSATALGLTVMDPEDEDIIASAQRHGGLSREDRLCFTMAKRNGWGCWTNDTSLRRQCTAEAIPVFWSLEVMLKLCRGGHLSPGRAETTATKIHNTNPHHITQKILARFIAKLNTA